MKILITGATGFIGSELVPYFSEFFDDCQILLFVRDQDKAKQRFNFFRNVIIKNHDDWNAIIQFNPNIVIHLAALNTSNENREIIPQLIESNITFGVKLLDAVSSCKDFRLFVNTGSFAEYRNGEKKIDCAYLYAASKAAYETFLKYYSDKYGFRAITAILYSVYGGDMTVKRVIDYIAESMKSSTPIEMTEGNQILDFIHVNDVVRFYAQLILNYDKVPLDVSNIEVGTGVGTKIRDVANILESITDRKCNINWGARSYRDRDIMFAKASISNISEWIKWNPIITLKNGLSDKYRNEYR